MKKIFPLFMLILIAAIVTMSGGWKAFLNIPSLLMVILLPLTATLVCFSFGELILAVKAAFRPADYDRTARKKASVIHKASARNLDYTGALGFLIGIVSMFANLTDEKYLTRGLALALIIIVYSVIIKFVFIIPMINSLEISLAGETD